MDLPPLEASVGGEATTQAGSLRLTFKVVDGKVLINDGPKVVATDVAASNGIIHVIDGVLLPPAK